jgi:hypothetical protein
MQPAVTKRIGPAARRKTVVMLPLLSCYAGLQLQVAKRILTAARRQFFNPTWNFLEFPAQSL